MGSSSARRAAIAAAAALIGPSMPPGFVAARPLEAATALTRMADLILPWLEAGTPASTIAQPGTAATASRDPATGEEVTHDRSERPCP